MNNAQGLISLIDSVIFPYPNVAGKLLNSYPLFPPQVVRLVRAIRKGLITFDEKPKEEKKPYLMWGDDSNSTERHHIPAPKPKLPSRECDHC